MHRTPNEPATPTAQIIAFNQIDQIYSRESVMTNTGCHLDRDLGTSVTHVTKHVCEGYLH